MASSLQHVREHNRITIHYQSGTFVPNIVGGGLLALAGLVALIVVALLVLPKDTTITCSRAAGTCTSTRDAASVPLASITAVRADASKNETWLRVATATGDVALAVDGNPTGARIDRYHEASKELTAFLADPQRASLTVGVPALPDLDGGGAVPGIFCLLLGLMYVLSFSRSDTIVDADAKTITNKSKRRGRALREVTTSFHTAQSVSVRGNAWRSVVLTTDAGSHVLAYGFGTPAVWAGADKAAAALAELLAVPIVK
ncbi:MAG TPA: hypothetical protein VGO62_12535 [Myxococcota bacterium]|jgi:hypothetical protein